MNTEKIIETIEKIIEKEMPFEKIELKFKRDKDGKNDTIKFINGKKKKA
jgi:hypothetical protein